MGWVASRANTKPAVLISFEANNSHPSSGNGKFPNQNAKTLDQLVQEHAHLQEEHVIELDLARHGYATYLGAPSK